LAADGQNLLWIWQKKFGNPAVHVRICATPGGHGGRWPGKTMLIWNDDYATGSPTIDGQHRQLINHVNELGTLLNKTNPSRSDIEFIIQFLEFLEGYLDTHFSYEEQCMENYGCPVHGKNKQAHERFRELFQSYKAHFNREGFRMKLLTDLHAAMSDWILDHILRLDTHLKACFKPRPPAR
jgi:hemerythrin